MDRPIAKKGWSRYIEATLTPPLLTEYINTGRFPNEFTLRQKIRNLAPQGSGVDIDFQAKQIRASLDSLANAIKYGSYRIHPRDRRMLKDSDMTDWFNQKVEEGKAGLEFKGQGLPYNLPPKEISLEDLVRIRGKSRPIRKY